MKDERQRHPQQLSPPAAALRAMFNSCPSYFLHLFQSYGPTGRIQALPLQLQTKQQQQQQHHQQQQQTAAHRIDDGACRVEAESYS